MIFTSLIVVASGRSPLTRPCLESLGEATATSEVCVVDDGSAGGTAEAVGRLSWPYPLRYERNEQPRGLIPALNQGARLASGDFLCFLQPDLEPKDPGWVNRLRSAVMDAEDVGLAGLCGARRLRRDGQYARRSVVHGLDGRAHMRSRVVEVAAVDDLCLFLRRDLLVRLGGFDEQARLVTGYGRDLSLAVRELGLRCAVVRMPFARCAPGPSEGEPRAWPGQMTREPREAALGRFARKWRHRLPSDVRGVRDRLADWLAWSGRRGSVAGAEC